MSFREYASLRNGTDVRGNALPCGEEEVTLTKERVVRIAAAFCRWLFERNISPRIAVGHDSRLTSDELVSWVAEGIMGAGYDAVFTGLSSTPSMFMLLQDGVAEASVMITASHLPKEKNGLKFFIKSGGLGGEDVKTVLGYAAEGLYVSAGKGKTSSENYLPRYAAALVEKVRSATGETKPLKGKRIVVDAGNGVGGFYVDLVLRPLGADPTGSQFLEPDGNFPHHIPNPENAEAMRSISSAVVKYSADFGIIFDTDADRAGAVMKGGTEINRNRLIALVSRILLNEKAGGTIVTDSVTSDGLSAFIALHGGVHHRFKRGYRNVIDEAKRLESLGVDCPLAIETSGHAALKENYFLDDGAYLVTRLLIALAQERRRGGDLLSLIADLPEPVEAEEIRLKFTCPDFKEKGERLLNDLKRSIAEGKDSALSLAPNNYEGVRIDFRKGEGDGWALLRMSLHEPLLPVNLESEVKGGVRKMREKLKNMLHGVDFIDLSPLDIPE